MMGRMKRESFNPLTPLYEKITLLKRLDMGEVPKNILDTMDILYENKKHKPLIITSKEDGKIGVRQYKGGWHFIFTMNPGCDFDYVKSNISMFQSCVKGDVEITKDGKYLHIDVNTFEFEKLYKFNPELIIKAINKPKIKKMYIPLVVGIKSGGKLLIVDLAKIPHVLVAGINNSGKSSWIKQVCYSIALTRTDVIIIYLDFKGADAWTIEPIGFSTNQANVALDLLQQLQVEVQKRQQFIYSNRLSKIHSLKDIPPILLAIDEITQMTDKNCQNILRNLLMTSRNAGVSIIAGTQKPSHKTYADFCESRSQFEARMSFRLSESKDSRLVLGNDKAYEFVKPNQGGRGIWQWGEESIIQSLFIDDDDIDKILNFNNHEFQTRRRKVKNYEKIRQQNFWLLPR